MIGLLGLLFSGAGMLTVLLGFGVAIALAIYLRLDRTVFVILLMAAGGYMLSERVFQAGVADCERRVELAVAKIERERAAAIAQVEEESKAEIQKLLTRNVLLESQVDRYVQEVILRDDLCRVPPLDSGRLRDIRIR